jgi:hypothetical protein
MSRRASCIQFFDAFASCRYDLSQDDLDPTNSSHISMYEAFLPAASRMGIEVLKAGTSCIKF